MPEQIVWTSTTQVVGGPRIAASQTEEVEAYGKSQVVVDANSVTTVAVQPDGGVLQFLLITADSYALPALTYTVDDEDATTDSKTLDAPLLLIRGGVGVLDTTLKSFTFTNNHSASRTVDILVGYDATPPPPPP